MRILIAGCGYVGSELARLLYADGHEVFGLRRDTSKLPEGILPVAADLNDPATLAKLPANIDVVFYAASANGYGEAPYRAAYVDSVTNVLSALKGQHVRRIFFASSTGVYAQNDGEWVDEASPATADRPTAQALRDGEALIRNADTESFPRGIRHWRSRACRPSRGDTCGRGRACRGCSRRR